MPAKSPKQYKFMAMLAHNPDKARKMGGPSAAVAKEMVHKTPAKNRSMFMRGRKRRKK